MPFEVRDAERWSYSEQHWREVYTDLLRPAVAAAGLECHREDDDYSSRSISMSIWNELIDANHTNASFQRCLWKITFNASETKPLP
jgi:hypothetical protein